MLAVMVTSPTMVQLTDGLNPGFPGSSHCRTAHSASFVTPVSSQFDAQFGRLPTVSDPWSN